MATLSNLRKYVVVLKHVEFVEVFADNIEEAIDRAYEKVADKPFGSGIYVSNVREEKN